MLVLFAVSFFQLSHSHSSVLVAAGKNKAPGFYCDNHTSNSTCFICDYQLIKDADNSYATYNIINIAGLYTPATVNYTFILQSIYPVFETRGPPCI